MNSQTKRTQRRQENEKEEEQRHIYVVGRRGMGWGLNHRTTGDLPDLGWAMCVRVRLRECARVCLCARVCECGCRSIYSSDPWPRPRTSTQNCLFFTFHSGHHSTIWPSALPAGSLWHSEVWTVRSCFMAPLLSRMPCFIYDILQCQHLRQCIWEGGSLLFSFSKRC